MGLFVWLFFRVCFFFVCVCVCVCVCACVRACGSACARVSTVFLSLSSSVVVPAFQCPFSFLFPCFWFLVCVSFVFVCVRLCVCV